MILGEAANTLTIKIERTVVEEVSFTKADMLRLIATSTFKPFSKTDWYGYSGCNTKDPLIAHFEWPLIEWNGFRGDLIMDGDDFCVFLWDDEGNSHTFTIKTGEMDYQLC